MVSYKLCELLSEYDNGESFDISVFCEEPRPAYDRVKLTSFFEKESADELLLAGADWYKEQKIRLLLGERAVRVDRGRRAVLSSSGEWIRFDNVVLATGSAPFVPPIPGVEKQGVFVYRTIEDLESHPRVRQDGQGGGGDRRRPARAGGGQGGARPRARDARRRVRAAPDAAPARRRRRPPAAARVEALGVKVHLARSDQASWASERAEGLAFKDGDDARRAT